MISQFDEERLLVLVDSAYLHEFAQLYVLLDALFDVPWSVFLVVFEDGLNLVKGRIVGTVGVLGQLLLLLIR